MSSYSVLEILKQIININIFQKLKQSCNICLPSKSVSDEWYYAKCLSLAV